MEPPPLKPSDDLEGLLRAFFRSQMPNPWPSPRVPSARMLPLRRSTTSRRSLIRSRWALAASVALLLLGSLLLPSRFPQNAKPEPYLTAPGTADSAVFPKRSKHPESKPDKNHPQLPSEDGDRLPEMDDSDLPRMK